MTSSSSLYGTVTTQNSSSSNSTSLYGEAGTPIPDSSGNVIVRGDLYVLSGNILTTAQTGNIFPANATTINLGLAATAVNIGANSGTTTINNNLNVDGSVEGNSADFGNIQIAVVDNQTISTTAGELRLTSVSDSIKLVGTTSVYTDNTGTFNLLNQPTTIGAFLSATSLNIGAVTGTTNINNNLLVEGTGTFTGDITAPGADIANITIGIADNQTIATTANTLKLSSATGDLGLVGIDTVYTDQSSILLFNSPTTVTAFDSATSLTLADITGTTNIRNNLLVGGTITGDSGDFGNITIGVTDAQTIDTTAGELRLSSTSNAIKLVGSTSVYTDNTGTFGFLNQPTTINAFLGATALNLGATTGTTNINNDLLIEGTSVGLAQNTIISYSEANNRLNRPAVRSTTGNSSGFRVEAPNATANAISTITAFNSNDNDNGKFININARGSGFTNDLRIQTGKYTAGVLGASGSVVSFIDNATVYATVNPAGPTDPLDLTTKAYVDAIDTNTTYTVDASSTTGGANFNLVGSDATTDTIKFASGTNVTVTATDANTITIASVDTNTTYTIDASSTTGGANLNLVGSDASTDTVKISSGTGVTVAQVNANELSVAIGQPVATSDSVTFADVTLDTLVNLNTATLTTTTTAANQVADSFVAATYRTCKYVIQITSGSVYQAVEALLVHDGSTAYINTYSDVRTGANLTSINAAVNGSNIELQVTPVNAATTYKISKTLIAV